jgi:FMN phosphatase YigB (HAD superfamily)
MNPPVSPSAAAPFTDPRIAELTRRIESGAYDVLSLDVFDTLVWRRVARPTDAFFLIADGLIERDAIWPSSTRASFVQVRIQAEVRARERARGMEVTLEQIWEQFPAGYLRGVCPAAGASLEFEVERALVSPHPDVAALAEHARAGGLKVALVSDTYFTEPQLRTLAGIDADFVIPSCAHGVSKYHGLHRILLAQCKVPASRVLHVGDNEQADVEGPKASRIEGFHLGKFPPEYERLIKREWPASLSRREEFVRADDAGLTALRGRALFQDASPHERWGAGVLGPVIAGFGDWVVERCADLGIRHALCLMREGRVFKQVIDTHSDGPTTHECFVSRYVTLKSAIIDGSEEELRAFVLRPSAQLRGRILRQLGLTVDDIPGDPDERLQPAECMALVRQIARDRDLRRKVVDESRATRNRLLAHLDSLLGPDFGGTVAVVDLGYKGTIQGCLQRILACERKGLALHGLYLVTGAEASETQRTGAVLEGWLAENGQPTCMAHTFVRSPEIAEQSLMADCGTTIGHTEDGTPVLDALHVAPAQRLAIADVQRGLLNWARAWAAHRAAHGISDVGSLRALYRSIAMNAVAQPLPIELELFGAWGHDENFGSAEVRTLLTSVGMHEWEREHVSAHQLASLPHTRIYWPFGLAASMSQGLGDAVAHIYMRTVPPEIFEAAEAPREATIWWDSGAGFTRRQSSTVSYTLNHRGRRWQRFTLTVDDRPPVGLGIGIGKVGEALRLAGIRLHWRSASGEIAVDTFEPADLEMQGFRHLHGLLWLVESDPHRVTIPARHPAGFRGAVDVDVFFGLLPGA